jgi:hypothetical protein
MAIEAFAADADPVMSVMIEQMTGGGLQWSGRKTLAAQPGARKPDPERRIDLEETNDQ